jgi:hypothetical protein
MPSKYAKVFSRLEKLPEDPAYQQQVDALKESIVNRSSSALSHTYAKLRGKKKEIDEELKGINLQIEAVSQLLIDAYEADDITTLKLTTGQTVRTQPEPYPTIQDKEKFRLWCLNEGLEREMHLHSQTASSLVKEMLLEGNPEPEGVKAFIKTKVVLTKA